MKPLKTKRTFRLHALDASVKAKLGFTGALEDKLAFLVAFAVLYGLIFINYIDIASSGLTSGYHLWLVLMYFLPFAGFSILNWKNWGLTAGLGLVASLMNDIFYGAVKYLAGIPIDLERYYSLWLIPQDAHLFNLNLGSTVVPVYSWMMATSIYLRVVAAAGLFWVWKRGQKPS